MNTHTDKNQFTVRPVEPRKTDISWAHEILNKADKPVKECV